MAQIRLDADYKEIAVWLNVSCLVVQIYMLMYEFIEMRALGLSKYLRNLGNLIDLTVSLMYFEYFYERFTSVKDKDKLIPILPDEF